MLRVVSPPAPLGHKMWEGLHHRNYELVNGCRQVPGIFREAWSAGCCDTNEQVRGRSPPAHAQQRASAARSSILQGVVLPAKNQKRQPPFRSLVPQPR